MNIVFARVISENQSQPAQPVLVLAAAPTGVTLTEREKGKLSPLCSCSGQRETQADWRVIHSVILNILSLLGSHFSGEDNTAAVYHELLLPYYADRNYYRKTEKNAFWVSAEGRWWKERKAYCKVICNKFSL